LSRCEITHAEKVTRGLETSLKRPPISGTYDGREILHLTFNQNDGGKYSFSVPSPNEAVIIPGTDLLDITNAAVIDFVTKAMACFVRWEPGPTTATANRLASFHSGWREKPIRYPDKRDRYNLDLYDRCRVTT